MNRVILVDKLWEGFVGQAIRESLLSSTLSESEREMLYPKYLRSRFKAESLVLFLLYDQIILPDDQKGLSLPDLEATGHVRFEASPPILTDIFSDSDWYANRDPKAFSQALELVVRNREFVLPEFKDHKDSFFDYLAKSTKIPRLKLIDHFLQFAREYYLTGSVSAEQPLVSILSPEIASIIEDNLREVVSNDEETLNPVDALLFGLMVTAERVEISKNLSVEFEAPTAGKVTHDGRYAFNARTAPQDPNTVIADFHVVRQVFCDADLCLPIPNTIQEALALKKDPNFRPFREQFTLFQKKFASGEIRSSADLLKEVRRAHASLRFASKMTNGMRFVTYSSLPTALAEALLMGGLPIISTATAIASTVGQAATDTLHKRNAWVLFGK